MEVKNITDVRPGYPCLKAFTMDRNLVVLFYKPLHGIVVRADEYEPGYHNETWDEGNFEEVRGTIEF